ncbi:CLUMA_CG013221, isoform A [Clunio marinus]|uniref:CLUMA_CG013221, isoform A n=1 Tax=Clunio marinus TaxID=568069 RepID=A0A1J1ILG7_9DIPT|nr:CLUMA_CG013221, isoform A [Clunio marinus]
MTNKHIASDFSNVLQEAQVIGIVVNPSDLKVAINHFYLIFQVREREKRKQHLGSLLVQEFKLP